MIFNYCPSCGQKDTVKSTNDTNYQCANCGWRYWNNPRAAVAVVFLRGNEFLASERALEPQKGKFDFPGGFLNYNESPVAGAIREIKEETSIDVDEVILVDVAEAHEYIPGMSVVDVVFAVTSWEGEPAAADDSAQLVWKPLEFIDNESFAWSYPGLAEKLRMLAE